MKKVFRKANKAVFIHDIDIRSESKPSQITVKWLEEDSQTVGCQFGLTFKEALQFVEEFNWGLYHGIGCAELTLYKGSDSDNYMVFHITQLGVDVFSVNLMVINKSHRKCFWNKSIINIDLGTCTKTELCKMLRPLGNYSVDRLYNKYRKEKIDNKIKLIVGVLLLSLLSFWWLDLTNILINPRYDFIIYNKYTFLFCILIALLTSIRIDYKKGLKFKDTLASFLGLSVLITVIINMFALVPVAPVHYLFSSPATQIEQVSELASSYLGSGKGSCRGRVWLRSTDSMQQERTMCKVPKALWYQLKQGDKIWMTGQRSPIGFTAEKMALIHRETS